MVIGIFSARTTNQLITSFIYLPLVFFFGTKIYTLLSNRSISIKPTLSKKSVSKTEEIPSPSTLEDLSSIPGVADQNKRLFLQLIGTTGISLLLLSLFSRKARDTFLGGGGSPTAEIVGIKDSKGAQIDPSEKHPTDGYSIADIDDVRVPAYYGFIKNSGAWYIMQNTSGTFRYAKGSSNYSSNWDIRAKIHFDYYNNVFS